MSRQFIKLAEEEELYNAISDHMVCLDAPKFTEGMSLQDYGAQCVAFEKLKVKVQHRLDDMLRIGQEYKEEK